jgi:hypothetical protein
MNCGVPSAVPDAIRIASLDGGKTLTAIPVPSGFQGTNPQCWTVWWLVNGVVQAPQPYVVGGVVNSIPLTPGFNYAAALYAPAQGDEGGFNSADFTNCYKDGSTSYGFSVCRCSGALPCPASPFLRR